MRDQVGFTPRRPNVSFKTATGDVSVTVYGQRLVATRVTGRLHADFLTRFMAPIDRIMVSGQRVIVYHDWEHLTGYDSEARVRLTTWATQFFKEIEAVHILTGSKIVHMGVSVANLALRGMITSYTNRHRFEQAFEEATRTYG